MSDNEKSLEKLSKEIENFRKKIVGVEAEKQQKKPTPFNVCVDFVSPLLVSGFLGYVLDEKFKTTPFIFLVFVLCGFLAGFYSVVKTGKKL